jgi:hypothetical protein
MQAAVSRPGLFDVPLESGICCAPGTGIGGACFSANRRFRYTWWRRWSDGPVAAFLMLNPSAADETQTDNTVTRCLTFVRTWPERYGALIVVNISPLVSTDRFAMYGAADRAGEPGRNIAHIARVTRLAHRVIFAFGASADHPSVRDLRDAAIEAVNERALLHPLPLLDHAEHYVVEPHALRITKNGWPEHPLYVPGSAKPVPYSSR